jgi:dihydroorotate dehydrogenase electron transfer subunit
MRSALLPVRKVTTLSGDCYVLEVEGPVPETAPGQFFMLRPELPWSVLLPRPFSLFDRDSDGRAASFLVKRVGPATAYFERMTAGERMWLTGPLGNRFPAAERVRPVCVAGGIGLAPFLLWAREQAATGGGPVDVLFGARTRDALAGRESFPEGSVRWRVSTDDGSEGLRGTVVDLMERSAEEGIIAAGTPVYCCGPDPMMHAVATWCDARRIPCWLSLETYMACGYGVCNGCSVRVAAGGRFGSWPYAKTCTEGPVFRSTELVPEH